MKFPMGEMGTGGRNCKTACEKEQSVTIETTALNHSEVVIRGWVRKFCHRCYNFVNRHDRLLYYTFIERATFLLYNNAKITHERNKYFEWTP